MIQTLFNQVDVHTASHEGLRALYRVLYMNQTKDHTSEEKKSFLAGVNRIYDEQYRHLRNQNRRPPPPLPPAAAVPARSRPQDTMVDATGVGSKRARSESQEPHGVLRMDQLEARNERTHVEREPRLSNEHKKRGSAEWLDLQKASARVIASAHPADAPRGASPEREVVRTVVRVTSTSMVAESLVCQWLSSLDLRTC